MTVTEDNLKTRTRRTLRVFLLEIEPGHSPQALRKLQRPQLARAVVDALGRRGPITQMRLRLRQGKLSISRIDTAAEVSEAVRQHREAVARRRNREATAQRRFARA